MDESFLHLYNAQNAIAVLEQNCNDRTTQYTVLKYELNNIKSLNVHLPILDHVKLLKNLEKDLSVDSSNSLLFHTLNSLLACSIPPNDNVPVGSHRKILDVLCTQIKNGEGEDITTYLTIMSNCLDADLYFYLVEMNPEMFAQMFKKFIIDESIERKISIMSTYMKLYLDNMISLTGIISLINMTIKDLLNHVVSMIFEETGDLKMCAVNLMSKLVPAMIKSNYRSLTEWVNIKQHLTNRYYTIIKDLLAKDDEIWHKMWILVVRLLSPEIHKSANVMNKLLSVIEIGLKTQSQISNTWDCWKVLITVYSEATGSGKGIQTLKYIKLLSCPFKRQLKYNTAFDKMFDTWIHLFANIPKEQFDENCAMLVRPFIEFSFGIHNDTTSNGLKIKEIFPKIIVVFVQMLGHTCENENCVTHNSLMKSLPNNINGYLSSKRIFEMYWKEILQCSGDMIKNLMKLNPLEFRWSDIASCVWGTVLKLTRKHFSNSDLISGAHEEIVRILTLLVLMSQNNGQLASVCLQSLLTKTAEDFVQNAGSKENKEEQLFKMIDLITLPAMVSCLDNDNLVVTYKNSLNKLLYNESSIKFAGNKILNVIKNSNLNNPTPDCTYNVYCEIILSKISEDDNVFINHSEILAQVVLQFLIFPFENMNILKMTTETVENMTLLYKKCSSEILKKEVNLKFSAELISKVYSSNEKISLEKNLIENSKFLIAFENNFIFDILTSLERDQDHDVESVTAVLNLTSQVINFVKLMDMETDVVKQMIKLIDKWISILKILSTNILSKCLQNFQTIFEDISEVLKHVNFEKYNNAVNNTIEDFCKHLIDNFKAKQNENKSYEKIVRAFTLVFKKFSITSKVLSELNSLVESNADSTTTTPVNTPTTNVGKKLNGSNSKKSPNGNTPKSKKCLEDDFIIVPKTPVRKPKYTEKQKEKMKERSADIPSLYNELSQQSQDTSSIDQKATSSIFTSSNYDAENISLLELSTNDFDNKSLESNDKVFVNKDHENGKNDKTFSGLNGFIENLNNQEKALTSSNNIISQFFNKSKLGDITNKCLAEDQNLTKVKNDTFVSVSSNDVVNAFKVDHKKQKEKSPDLIQNTMNDSDQDSTDKVMKPNADNANSKKRSRKELEDNGSDCKEKSSDEELDEPKKTRTTQQKKEKVNGIKKRSPLGKNINSATKDNVKKNKDKPKNNQVKDMKNRKESESESDADSVSSARSKLNYELKRISMDIKDMDKFTNLGNRRSKTTPQKFSSLRRPKGAMQKKQDLNRTGNNRRRLVKNKKNNSDQSNKINTSDNIDEVESFEEAKTVESIELTIKEEANALKNVVEGSSNKKLGVLQTKIISNKIDLATQIESNISIKDDNYCKIESTPSKKMNASKIEIDANTEQKCASGKDYKNEMQWLSATPKQKLEVVQTSTPKVQNGEMISDNVNDLDNFRESLDMVASSQEECSQSLFLTGMAGNCSNMLTKKYSEINSATVSDNRNIETEKETMTKDINDTRKESLPIILLENASHQDNCQTEKSTESDNKNVGATLKPLTSFETSNLNTSKIIASPEQDDFNERNNELLNNTLDISPIRIDGPEDVIPSGTKDASSTELHHTTGSSNLLTMNNSSPLSTQRSRLHSSSANKGPKSRSAHMLGLCNREVPVIDSNATLNSPVTKQRELLFTKHLDSPSNSNMRAARLLKLSDKDLLTFKKDVPSPNASPSASILKRAAKRKITEDMDVDFPPNKSKRVSFNDPIFTTKYLLKESISSPQDSNSTTPCVRKQLIADEKFVMELNNDNMELFCKPINVEDEFNKAIVPDSEEIMGIEEQIEKEKSEAFAETETQTQIDSLNSSDDQVFNENKETMNVDIETQTQTESSTRLDSPEMDCPETPILKSRPIFADLITCLDPVGDSVDYIYLKTKSEAVQEFKKNIFTISDLARLTASEVNKAPIRSPKINNLRRALREYAKTLQNSELLCKNNNFENMLNKDIFEKSTSATNTDEEKNVDCTEDLSKLLNRANSMQNSENLRNCDDSDLMDTQVSELLDKDYLKVTKGNKVISENSSEMKFETVTVFPKIKKTDVEDIDDDKGLTTERLSADQEENNTPDLNVVSQESTFVFDKDVLRQTLQQHFNHRPLETYEIVQDLIKEMLQKKL